MRASLCIEIGMLKLLALLKDGQFHSGEALGAVLGVSRSAVWKQLQLLESELDLTVFKVRGRGYRLAAPLLLLEASELAHAGGTEQWPVLIYDEVDSTNAEALRLVSAGRPAPFVVVAERQSAGRGRRGRAWSSPYAQNLYYSLVLRIDGGMRQLEGMSLVVGLAVREALASLGISNAGLKWPNDVLVAGRKISGILLELVGDPVDVCHVVIGVGINANMRDSEIDQAWTSVCLESGQMVDRNLLAARLGESLSKYLARHRAEGFSGLQAEWEQAHLWQDRPVSLIAGANIINGTALGVDRQGALRLCIDGVEKSFSGGELSLRLRDDS